MPPQKFSPRTRRCFRFQLGLLRLESVFSAYAEVFPLQINFPPFFKSFLRVRGGVSWTLTKKQLDIMFSPRTRRCFRPKRPLSLNRPVFSAYAEVFPEANPTPHRLRRFLRVRGGVSVFLRFHLQALRFSPRTRRCFCVGVRRCEGVRVFSAYAEVFPSTHSHGLGRRSFLRVRGGVSS